MVPRGEGLLERGPASLCLSCGSGRVCLWCCLYNFIFYVYCMLRAYFFLVLFFGVRDTSYSEYIVPNTFICDFYIARVGRCLIRRNIFVLCFSEKRST